MIRSSQADLGSEEVTGSRPRDLGVLVAFEGIDGAGKSTQVKILAESLRRAGIAVAISRSMSSTLAVAARSEFLDSSPDVKTLLFTADRIQRLEQQILPAFREGVEVVLLDRWTLSTEAYRVAEGRPLDYIRAANAVVPPADVTLVFKMDPEAAWRRGEAVGELPPYRREVMALVAAAFETVAPSGAVFVDAARPIEVVAETVADAVMGVLR